MFGVLLTILLMIGVSTLSGASELLEEAFQGDWMDVSEWEYNIVNEDGYNVAGMGGYRTEEQAREAGEEKLKRLEERL